MATCKICLAAIKHGNLCNNCYRLQSSAYAKLAKNLNKIVALKRIRTKNEERFSRFSSYVSNVYEAWEDIRKFKQCKTEK